MVARSSTTCKRVGVDISGSASQNAVKRHARCMCRGYSRSSLFRRRANPGPAQPATCTCTVRLTAYRLPHTIAIHLEYPSQRPQHRQLHRQPAHVHAPLARSHPPTFSLSTPGVGSQRPSPWLLVRRAPAARPSDAMPCPYAKLLQSSNSFEMCEPQRQSPTSAPSCRRRAPPFAPASGRRATTPM